MAKDPGWRDIDMIRIFEVGPRDGLQNLPHVPSTEDKIQLIKHLRDAGLTRIEVTSFVHPKAVPNMADAEQVCAAFDDKTGFSVLVPNQRGMDRAIASGMTNYNIFFSPCDTFNVSNYGLKLERILDNYEEALDGIDPDIVRVYISEAFESGSEALSLAIQHGLRFGKRIVLCDTKGSATPFDIATGVGIAQGFTHELSLHLHHGKHLMENVSTGYSHGVREFDSSIGGLGGCPFVESSGANLATEDLVKWCKKRGIDCGVKLSDLKAARKLAHKIKNPTLKIAAKNKYKETKNRFKAVWY